jgi:hypothetical protein
MTRRNRMSVVIGLLLAAVTNAPSTATPPAAPKACEPGSTSRLEQPPTREPGTTDPGKNDPSITTGSGAHQNPTLSDRLARSDGVLCPPNVDPDIRMPPPAGGKTPVIPPPGTPGGDPSVRPR